MNVTGMVGVFIGGPSFRGNALYLKFMRPIPSENHGILFRHHRQKRPL
jgi:hypothetical protein